MQTTKNSYYHSGDKLVYLVIFYLIFAVLFFFFDSRGVLSFVHKGAQVLTVPVRLWLYDSRVTLLSPFGVFSFSAKQNEQIRKLEVENASLLTNLARQSALEEENAKMRHLLGTDLPAAWQFAPARVVSVAGDTMSIVGDSTPFIVGTPVVTTDKGGVWVGKVESVVGRTSVVFLATHTSSKTPAIVRGSQDGSRHASGIVIGRGGSSRLEQVLTSEVLAEGDLILTSGESLPPELLIGRVRNVIKNPSSPWQQAEVEVAVQANNLDFVFLITKY